jgi:hypothetical protein
MSTQSSTTKIPTPLYAAAGAGDFAYQQIRKLPEQVAVLRERVAELRPVVTEAVAEVNLRADLDRLRDVARRNAAAIVAAAEGAQDRAVAVYGDLVSRGEQVVRNTRGAEATVAFVPSAGSLTAEATTTPVPVSAVARSTPRPAATKATATKAAPTKRAPRK